MASSPESLILALKEMEDADEQSVIAILRAHFDGERVAYREAGATPEQQAAIIMAAALQETVFRNPILALLIKDDFMKTVVYVLAALK